MSDVETEDGQSDARALRRAFQQLVRRFGLLTLDHTACGHPIAVSQAHALMELRMRPGLRQHDLARTLGLSKSAVTRMVEQLLRRSWIERQADDGDGRAWRLHLSDAGRRMARQVDEASLSRFSSILKRIPPSQRGQVIRALVVLHGAIPEGAAGPRGAEP